MAVTKTDLKVLGNEVTCVVSAVESGVGYLYAGDDQGKIQKYNMATQALTTIVQLVGESIASMVLYSGILWVTLKGGKIVQVTTY